MIHIKTTWKAKKKTKKPTFIQTQI